MILRDWGLYILASTVVSGVLSLFLLEFSIFGSISQMINGKAYGKDYSIPGVEEVLNSKDEYGPRENYWSLVRTDDIDMPRRLSVSTSIKPEYVAVNQEPLPEKEYLDIFVEQRLENYGKAECEVLKQHLASECVLLRSNARQMRNGRYRVTFSFGFVQKEPLGEFDKSGTVTYAETEKHLTKKVDYYYANNEGTRDYRSELYREIRDECNDLKFRQSNCAITDITVHDGDLAREAARRQVRATFTLSYFDTNSES